MFFKNDATHHELNMAEDICHFCPVYVYVNIQEAIKRLVKVKQANHTKSLHFLVSIHVSASASNKSRLIALILEIPIVQFIRLI